MSAAIYTATSGALVQEMRLEILANNLSNVNTVGFKKGVAAFRMPDSSESMREVRKKAFIFERLPIGPGYLHFETRTDFSPGPLKRTGNALDLALRGNGFFCIKTPEGVQYTRNGSFSLNQESVLVTQQGLPVLGSGGEIRIDGEDFAVDGGGNISVDGNQIGAIKIVDFPQPYPIEKVGDTLFAHAGSGKIESEAEGTEVMQGFIELSNVDAIRGMTEMIEVLRAYESYQKVIQSIDEVTSKAINEVGRLA